MRRCPGMGRFSMKGHFFCKKSCKCRANVKECAGFSVDMHTDHTVCIIKYTIRNHILFSGIIADLSFFYQLVSIIKINKFFCRCGKKADLPSCLFRNLKILQDFQHIRHDRCLNAVPAGVKRIASGSLIHIQCIHVSCQYNMVSAFFSDGSF